MMTESTESCPAPDDGGQSSRDSTSDGAGASLTPEDIKRNHKRERSRIRTRRYRANLKLPPELQQKQIQHKLTQEEKRAKWKWQYQRNKAKWVRAAQRRKLDPVKAAQDKERRKAYYQKNKEAILSKCAENYQKVKDDPVRKEKARLRWLAKRPPPKPRKIFTEAERKEASRAAKKRYLAKKKLIGETPHERTLRKAREKRYRENLKTRADYQQIRAKKLAAKQAWDAKNSEHIKEYTKTYNAELQADPVRLEHSKQVAKQWVKNNRARIRKTVKAHADANRERLRTQARARSKKRYKEDAGYRAKIAAEVVRRRALKKTTVVNKDKVDWFYAWVRAAEQCFCYYCTEEVAKSKREIDHIIPLSRNGPHRIDNLCVAHEHCNCVKHARTISEWMRSEGYVGQMLLDL